MNKLETKISTQDLWFVRVVACAAFLMLVLLMDQYIHEQVAVYGRPDGYLQDRIQIVDNLAVGGFLGLCLALFFNRVCSLLLNVGRYIFRLARKLGKAAPAFFFLAVLLYAAVVVLTQPNVPRAFFLRWPLLIGATLLGAAALKNRVPGHNRNTVILLPFLLLIVLYRFLNYAPGITSYPLSLGWSETSNFVYTSQFLAQKLYGLSAPMPLINPGRALMSLFPLLLPQPQLWASRLWEAMLWAGLTTLTAGLITRRLKLGDWVKNLGLAAWIILFLYQGPIYYDVLTSVCLVLWLFKPQHFWRSLLVVAAASAWVGITRLNWFPMPGILAGLLYVFEQPKERTSWFTYMARPAAWVAVGLPVAFGAMLGYGAISGNGMSDNSTVFTSPLLWYRLLPNATYAWGILPPALVVAFPALCLIGVFLAPRGQARRWNRWRILFILASLGVYFFGGIIVSLKIGGGGDLHNLDGFWFLLALVCVYLYFQRFPGDQAEPAEPARPAHVPALIMVLLVGLPVTFQLIQRPFYIPPSYDQAMKAISGLQTLVSDETAVGKPVLFITEKQLITFGKLPGVPMVFDYDKVYLLEMAMSGSTGMLQKFYNDLAEGRFGLIVVNPQGGMLKPLTKFFAAENNVQIERIGRYLECYTHVIASWEALGIEVRSPRPVKGSCP